ncbi:MAG: IS110 family transposase [Desulfatiglans sp.]|nr:IS110 family transposase [Desulfatiglans sp.]
MNKNQVIQKDNNTREVNLYMAMELSDKKWKLAFSDGSKERLRTIDAGEMIVLWKEIADTKEKFKLDEEVKVISCYEAGRDGFWIHRCLLSNGIDNNVIDPASVEVDRRRRRKKTDRLDAKKLLMALMRHMWGDKQACSMVRVPSVEDEDDRQLHRELESLKKERTRHSNRIRSLLISHGVRIENPGRRDFIKYLDSVRLWDGSEISKNLKDRLKREHDRYSQVEDQIKELEGIRKILIRDKESESMSRVRQMLKLKGIGIESSWILEKEFFGWRKFKNRKEVGSLSGLSPTPYSSGNSNKEQGINKAGNRRVRAIIVEISWIWIRFQKESKLTKWFNERFASGGKRMRRIGIVAVARKLLIDIWRYIEHGVIPEGAVVA